MTPLPERIAKTTAGQVTWAEPEKRAKCTDCSHVRKLPKATSRGTHKCALCKIHSGREGQPYFADRAIACSMFERRPN